MKISSMRSKLSKLRKLDKDWKIEHPEFKDSLILGSYTYTLKQQSQMINLEEKIQHYNKHANQMSYEALQENYS